MPMDMDIGFLDIFFLFTLPYWVFWMFVVWFSTSCLYRVPVQYRKQHPWFCWLILMPFISFIFQALVFPMIVESFVAYFKDHEEPSAGTCGRSLANAVCLVSLILFCLQLVLFTSRGVFMASYLVLGVVYFALLVAMMSKFNKLKQMIPSNTPN